MYSKSNLQFPNYNEVTQTNDKLENHNDILVYLDSEHSIYLGINNAAPYEIYLFDTFNDEDYDVVSTLESTRDIETILIEYLNNSN